MTWLVVIVMVLAGVLLSSLAFIAILAVALLLVMPSVYWRVIARGKYYCSRCDIVLPRDRLFPRKEGAHTHGDPAS